MDVLRDLRNDRVSGASRLALRSLGAFVDLARVGTTSSGQKERERLSGIAASIIRAQPSMASVLSCMADLFPLEGRTASEVRRTAIRKARLLSKTLPLSEEKISRHGAHLLTKGQKVLTISCSSAVLSILRRASPKGVSVLVCESSPGREGRTCARTLSPFMHTTLIPDFCVSRFMPEANLVLVGADSVSPTHLTNKCGTRLLAREARACGVPVVCASDSSKILPFPLPIRELRRVEGRLTRRGALFDMTPLGEIDAFVTERGIRTPADIVRIAQQKKKTLLPILSFAGAAPGSPLQRGRHHPPGVPRRCNT